ncbi:MAG: FAD-dependent oxidoreductase [Desulfobacteraceae bacterium]|nr:MAG: FAD-dependent oxidoreductase [Desulfobacteraceae bacterium]
MQGRTHKPELRPELCGTCGACRGACPGQVFRDLSAETDTARGRLSISRPGRAPNDRTPCVDACPLGQSIPAYLRRISAGDRESALELILQENPFPAVLGHVCHRPCEDACGSAPVQRPPAIRELKRFASGAKRPQIRISDHFTGANVAVVGAGPAGLASAWALAREGVRVTVYEALPFPGGMPAWAIPPFRLPRQALQEDIDHILRHGVELRLDKRLLPNEVLSFRSVYDAVVLACGADPPKPADFPGARFPRVWSGIDFLRQAALGPPPDVRGPVAVFGGGNVAIDVARWALRMAAPVTLIFQCDREQMTAYREEMDAAEEEGLQFLFRTRLLAIEGGPRKGVRQIRVQATVPGQPGEDGRAPFVPLPGSERSIPAETAVLSLSQDEFQGRAEWLGLGSADRRESGLLTEKICAAGDMITGPATVVEAIAGGILCARKIFEEVLS